MFFEVPGTGNMINTIHDVLHAFFYYLYYTLQYRCFSQYDLAQIHSNYFHSVTYKQVSLQHLYMCFFLSDFHQFLENRGTNLYSYVVQLLLNILNRSKTFSIRDVKMKKNQIIALIFFYLAKTE